MPVFYEVSGKQAESSTKPSRQVCVKTNSKRTEQSKAGPGFPLSYFLKMGQDPNSPTQGSQAGCPRLSQPRGTERRLWRPRPHGGELWGSSSVCVLGWWHLEPLEAQGDCQTPTSSPGQLRKTRGLRTSTHSYPTHHEHHLFCRANPPAHFTPSPLRQNKPSLSCVPEHSGASQAVASAPCELLGG